VPLFIPVFEGILPFCHGQRARRVLGAKQKLRLWPDEQPVPRSSKFEQKRIAFVC
jgi:hypothetical protein